MLPGNMLRDNEFMKPGPDFTVQAREFARTCGNMDTPDRIRKRLAEFGEIMYRLGQQSHQAGSRTQSAPTQVGEGQMRIFEEELADMVTTQRDAGTLPESMIKPLDAWCTILSKAQDEDEIGKAAQRIADWGMVVISPDSLKARIDALVNRAVAEEREACAKMVETDPDGDSQCGVSTVKLATAIRERMSAQPPINRAVAEDWRRTANGYKRDAEVAIRQRDECTARVEELGAEIKRLRKGLEDVRNELCRGPGQ